MIPKKKALIAWDVKNGTNLVDQFIVFEKDPGDREPEYIRKLTLTTGNCLSIWEELSELQTTLHILRIFFDYDFGSKENVKNCLLQCGQIKELRELRELVRSLYYHDWTMQEFEEKFYSE